MALLPQDLHRTGCTGFSGAKQAVLKQVLVSYARWNPAVGYCQGFNMIGAMLLQMTAGNERLTLKILIFLIEGVLPEGKWNQSILPIPLSNSLRSYSSSAIN
jgi:hypothetical protein